MSDPFQLGWRVTDTSEIPGRYKRTEYGDDGVTKYDLGDKVRFRFHKRHDIGEPEARARGLAAVIGPRATVRQWADGGWRVEVTLH